MSRTAAPHNRYRSRLYLRRQYNRPDAEESDADYDIWNANSPQVQLVTQKFESAKLGEWNNDRIVALCRSLGWTIWVLCAQCGAFRYVHDNERDLMRLKLDVSLIQRSWAANRWPMILVAQFDRFEKYDRARKIKQGETFIASADRSALKHLTAHS